MTAPHTQWFTDARFGLFIHWGLYSLAARHEWVMQREQVPAEEYEARYFGRFDPDLYDPQVWAAAAADAGMKYFVITTKHHEGFCLWDSRLTEYKATRTPAGRDLLRPMVEAFRQRDLRVGFYYSLLDWHHPHFPIDSRHPLYAAKNRDQLNQGRDIRQYAQYLHGQVSELLSDFGTVDVLWCDFSYPPGRPGTPVVDQSGQPYVGKGRDDWNSPELLKLIRQLQPRIILNDRLDLGNEPGAWDVKTPEQFQPRCWYTVGNQRVMWEACQTFSGSWGYHRDEQSWRSVEQLILTLIDCVSKGGNLLLNVGPTARGEFDRRALDRLAGIGQWMRRHGRSIYGCTQAPDEFTCPRDCRLTYNPDTNRLYVHVLNWPYKYLHLDGQIYKQRAAYAQLLHDASEVKFKSVEPWQEAAAVESGFDSRNTLTLELPQTKPDVTYPVIELFLKP